MTVGGWGANLKRAVSWPRTVHELVADDFDDLLGGVEGGGDLGAEGLGADVLDDFAGDVEVDVGLEEGDADLAEGVVDVFVGEGALAAQVFEAALELFGEVLKHGWFKFIGLRRGRDLWRVRERQRL